MAGQSPALSFDERLAIARAQDAADLLAGVRAQFALPSGSAARPMVYLCGHSLGLAPRAARGVVEAAFDDWERLGVLGHEHANSHWVDYVEALQGPLAELAGAQPAEVIAMNSLTINLHLLLARFYRPQGARRTILIEAGAFSSDRHALATQIAWHGLHPTAELLELAPRAGEDLLRLEDIEAAISQAADRLALVLWPAVQFRTGQRFDLAAIARATHAAGGAVGFDLAHAIGNVPLSLHADQADFAVWCSYKYLNGGPGAVGGAFVHERHFAGGPQPALAGWWGHEATSRFLLRPQFLPASGAAAFAVSNPPIFSSAPLRASLPLFVKTGMPALRRKSLTLTAYLQSQVAELVGDELTLVTPGDPEQRGCQLSWRVRGGAQRAARLYAGLTAQDVIGDLRDPDILRLTPVPLYNSYEDVLRAAWQLGQLVRTV